MSDELKPVRCGCGGRAEINHYIADIWYEPEERYVISCAKCHISTDACFTEIEAITAWNKAMSGKDINVPIKGFWKPVYESEATGFDPSLAGCDPVFNHVCSICGQETLTNDLGEEYLSDFCPHCGTDMRNNYE